MGKKKQKQRVTEYFTSIQYAICHGVVEKLLSIRVNDKIVGGFEGAGSTIDIHQPELFGGIKKEGGLRGRLFWQDGSADQLVNAYVAAKKGLTPSTMPGYRGIATAFFTERPGERPGFYWSANQPIIPPVHFQVKRIDRSWRPDIAGIDREVVPEPVSYSLGAAFPIISAATPGYPVPISNYPNSIVIGPFPEFRLITAGPLGVHPDDRFVFNGVVFGDEDYVYSPPGTLLYSLPAGETLTVQIQNRQPFLSGAGGTLIATAQIAGAEDMNPAHIIRECLINSVWGLGLPESALDMTMFEAAAETLYAEQFGLSMIWTRQAPIQDFISDILSHIQGTVYVNPMTGKIALKLIRNDYNAATLDVLDPSNSRVTSFKRRSPAEITNEIAVTWTNPSSEKEEVVTMQSLGSIVANNGEVVSDNRNYYGVRRAALAAELCARDLASSVAPLSTAEVSANRQFSQKVPGDVVKLTDPENGAFELIMRIMKVDYGRLGDSTVALTLSEDVFSFDKPVVNTPPTTQNPPQSFPPNPPTFIEFITLNSYMNFNSSDGLEDLVEPETQVAFFVATNNRDTYNVEIFREETSASGAVVYDTVGDFDLTSMGVLTAVLPAEVESFLALPLPTAGFFPTVGRFVLFAPTGIPEHQHEIALVTAFNGDTGQYTLSRGMMDTVPREWAIGTPVRYFDGLGRIVNPVAEAAGISKNYKFVTRTSLGSLPDALVPTAAYTPTDRLQAPTRPANVVVAGAAFGTVDALALTTISVSWANRNRLTEDAVLLGWDEPTVTPEAGQTTTVRLIDYDTGITLTEYTGLTGTSLTFPASDRSYANAVSVTALSARDGIESIQAHSVLVQFPDFLRRVEDSDDERGTETGDFRRTED